MHIGVAQFVRIFCFKWGSYPTLGVFPISKPGEICKSSFALRYILGFGRLRRFRQSRARDSMISRFGLITGVLN